MVEVFKIADVLSSDIFSQIIQKGDILFPKNPASKLSAKISEIIRFSFQSLLD